MTIEEFKKMTPDQLKEYGKTIPYGKTWDVKGKLLKAIKDRDDFWFENIYDENGNQTGYIDNFSHWYESKHDNSGNKTFYRNSFGFWFEAIYEKGERISYKDVDGTFKIGKEWVNEKEFEAFMEKRKKNKEKGDK